MTVLLIKHSPLLLALVKPGRSRLTREPVSFPLIFRLPVGIRCLWLLRIKGLIFTATSSACINRHQHFSKRQAFLFVEESGSSPLVWHPLLTACRCSDSSFSPPQWRLTGLTLPFITCGVREMRTSFSLCPLPYFPSFGLKRTNKPSIFRFSEDRFPSSCCSNAFKWKEELRTGCCLGDLQALWNDCFFSCFAGSVIDSTFPR